MKKEKSEASRYQVLLYYKYVPIENAEVFAKRHLKFCKELGLRGRILIADEGINGTVSGTIDQTEQYMKILGEDERFRDMEFKIDPAHEHAFAKMFVRYREEIVTLGIEDDIDPNQTTGNRLSPKEFYQAMQEENTVVIDARNDYETDLGHFRNAICPDVRNFRELPAWVEAHQEELKGKKILTYCTGGIRCEKFSGLLKKEGFDDVFQLHGGIVEYGKDEEVRGKLFDGKCYVFDERISVDVNRTKERNVISTCSKCDEKSSRYVNCRFPDCNRQFFLCEKCEEEKDRFCSSSCYESYKEKQALNGKEALKVEEKLID